MRSLIFNFSKVPWPCWPISLSFLMRFSLVSFCMLFSFIAKNILGLGLLRCFYKKRCSFISKMQYLLPYIIQFSIGHIRFCYFLQNYIPLYCFLPPIDYHKIGRSANLKTWIIFGLQIFVNMIFLYIAGLLPYSLVFPMRFDIGHCCWKDCVMSLIYF